MAGRGGTDRQGAAGSGKREPTLQGVSRALRILDLLARGPMKAADVADALGVPWASCHRALMQLEQDDFIQRGPAGEFRIGRHTWLLGSTYLVGHRLLDLAVPMIQSAAVSLPTAVFQLVERSDNVSLVLYSYEAGAGEQITRAAYGHHFPLHGGAKGLVLLAYAEPAVVEHYLGGPLLPLTPATITQPDELRAALAEIRERGYAVTLADVQTFTGSVAAPVFDGSGSVVASLCVIMRSAELGDDPTRADVIERVTRLAESLSLGLGWQPVRAAQRAHQPPVTRRRPGRPPAPKNQPGIQE